MAAVAKKSIPVFNSNSRVFNSNSIFNSTNFNSNSRIGIELQFQFRNWIDPNPATCPHNIPDKPSCYNNEQTTKQTNAINNSQLIYIYIYVSCQYVTQTVPDISPLMPMHQQVGRRSWIYVQHVNLRTARRFTCCPYIYGHMVPIHTPHCCSIIRLSRYQSKGKITRHDPKNLSI